jgi:hypothetical protein
VSCLLVVWPIRVGDWVWCLAAARKEADDGTRELRLWPSARMLGMERHGKSATPNEEEGKIEG